MGSPDHGPVRRITDVVIGHRGEAVRRVRLTELVRYPGLLAGCALGGVLFTMVLSAFPLFISASASELVTGEIHRIATRTGAGIVYRSTDVRMHPSTSGTDYPAYTELDGVFATRCGRRRSSGTSTAAPSVGS